MEGMIRRHERTRYACYGKTRKQTECTGQMGSCYRRVVIERLGLDFTQLEDSSVKSLASGQLLNCTAKQRCDQKGSGHI